MCPASVEVDIALVWYVAYGSNLSPARLQRYIERCDPTDAPLDARAIVLGHRLFFAHESRIWTGGTAFVDPTPDPAARTLAMAWLVRADQFAGIVAQENGGIAGSAPVDVGTLGVGDTTEGVVDGRYGLIVGCTSPDDRPALTFTTPEHPLPGQTIPSPAYVDVMVAGLVAGHGLTIAAARAYVDQHVFVR